MKIQSDIYVKVLLLRTRGGNCHLLNTIHALDVALGALLSWSHFILQKTSVASIIIPTLQMKCIQGCGDPLSFFVWDSPESYLLSQSNH